MTRNYLSLAFAASAVSTTMAFAPNFAYRSQHSTALLRAVSVSGLDGGAPSVPLEEKVQNEELQYHETNEAPPTAKKVPRRKVAPKHGADGVLAPVVLLAKDALGDERLNKIRAKAISLHADVIGNFIDMTSSPAGRSLHKILFDAVDRNDNGMVEEDELAEALRALGFDWLKEKQVQGIFKRADADDSGYIDFDEWISEAPKTLRTNLIKLAKKNGGRLGLLA